MNQRSETSPARGQTAVRRRTSERGRVVAEKYVLEECIGRGGYGMVYRARQLGMERDVALKMLRITDDGEPLASRRRRFAQEAAGLGRLNHPNVVTVFDYGTDGDDAYLVMEYVDGETLLDLLDREGALDLETFAEIAGPLADALGHVHEHHLLHRDIKPNNVMLSRKRGEGMVPKLVDFGLAKLLDQSVDITRDMLVGASAYMAPERIVAPELADGRADVYALGVLYYRMLTARLPFVAGDEFELLSKHMKEPVPALRTMLPPGREVPPALEALVHQCLAKMPEDRPASAHVVCSELERIVGQAASLRTSSEFIALPASSSGEIEALTYDSVEFYLDEMAPPEGAADETQEVVVPELDAAPSVALTRRQGAALAALCVVVIVVLVVAVVGLVSYDRAVHGDHGAPDVQTSPERLE